MTTRWDCVVGLSLASAVILCIGACGGNDAEPSNNGDGGDGGSGSSSDAGKPVPLPVSTIAELGIPFDVNREDIVGPAQHAAQYGKSPEIIGRASVNGIDVLWQDRSDEKNPKAFLVHLAPDDDDFVVTAAFDVPTLDRIMGFTGDSDGNYYVVTGIVESLHEPLTTEYPPPGTYREDVVHLLKMNSLGETQFQTDVDTARSLASDEPEALINPMVASSSRLAFGNGTVAMVHGINTDPDNDGVRHQKALTTHFDSQSGEVTKTSSIWVSHSFDQRLFHDGQGFVEMHLGDAYPRTIALGRVTPDTGTRHDLFHIKGALGSNNTRTRLGDAVMLDTSVDHGPWGYLALIATERTSGLDAIGSAAKIAGSRDLALVRVRGAFDESDNASMEQVDHEFGVTQTLVSRDETRTNYVRWMTHYEEESLGTIHAERPKLVALGNDRYILLWEEWSLKAENDKVSFDGTHGMVIDGNGAIIQADTNLTATHLPRGDDAFSLDGRVFWITGDSEKRELQVHIVDPELNYRRATVE